ncbi:unnamed protein product [Arctia plantaginis]|uniref:Uncharacterized protein n=1 Tax=Arctia plantaginis TaxID=874455 RepID=A0A8S1BHX2_ARCPL|nr:unnamed protein product [Arctia plantaginis]CAB3257949.1 unnamed protein product [Arctia plantaginis]
MGIVIHKSDSSPSSRAVLMIAEILNLRYETRDVNVLIGDHMKPEYLKKNPEHTVPLLEDGDFVLADSHAIITYLVSKYGADKRAELYPSDLALRGTIDHRLFFDATVLLPISERILLGKTNNLNEEEIEEVQDAYGILDKYLQETRFVACDYLTLADISCIASVSTMDVLVPVDENFERVFTWITRLKDEDWYQMANIPGLNQIAEFLKNTMDDSA